MAADSAHEERHHLRLSRSPSPTLIFPLQSDVDVQTNETPGPDLQADRIQKAAGFWARVDDSHGTFQNDPAANNQDESQNSPVAARQCTFSPEGKRIQQKGRKLSAENSSFQFPRDVSSLTVATPGKAIVVTDIDQAMAQMDEVKLKSLFGNKCSTSTLDTAASPNAACNSYFKDNEMEETNIDDEPRSAKRLSSLRQKSVEMEQHLAACPMYGQQKKPVTKQHSLSAFPLDEAIRWPLSIPKELDVNNSQGFDGETLAKWLCSQFDESHYLHHILTHHDFWVITGQFCTHLLFAGVLRNTDYRQKEMIFKSHNEYKWGGKEVKGTSPTEDDHSIPARSSADIQESFEDEGHQQTQEETEQQATTVQLKSEFKAHEERLKKDHEQEIHRIKEGFAVQADKLKREILALEKELNKYRTIAGIEALTQDALHAAEAARQEAGLQDLQQSPELVLAVTGTPNHGSKDNLPERQYESNLSNITQDKDTSELKCQPNVPPTSAPKILHSESHLSGPESPSAPKSAVPSHSPPTFPPKGCPPPPPPPPPPPVLGGPPPPPPPPPLGAPGHLLKKEHVKPIISPKSPMKPLFWKRIQVQAVKNTRETSNKNLFWEEISEEPINFEYFEELFAKVPIEPKRKASTAKAKPKPVQPAKVIPPKRSQAVGILLSSLRLEFSDIEDAILNLDTSALDVEKFKAIYDNRPVAEEMAMIKKQLDKHPDIPLDKPDQFLYDLEQIPFAADRIFCFIFQSFFQENINMIDSKLNNLKMTCEFLSSYDSVRRIFGLILACGNYMNGGSRTRGQADGFDLEILSKLKDVKGKDNRTSLLQFVVTRYVCEYEKDIMGTDRAKLPLPDPSDIQQAALVSFEDIEKELRKTRRDFESAESKANNIIQCSNVENVEPFRCIMVSFFDKGRQDLQEEEENLRECSQLFSTTCEFFCVKPKPSEKTVTPEHFFSFWLSFCSDFKDIWKKEQQNIMKRRIWEAEEKVKTIKDSKAVLPPTRAKKAGGLKDKLSRQGKI